MIFRTLALPLYASKLNSLLNLCFEIYFINNLGHLSGWIFHNSLSYNREIQLVIFQIILDISILYRVCTNVASNTFSDRLSWRISLKMHERYFVKVLMKLEIMFSEICCVVLSIIYHSSHRCYYPSFSSASGWKSVKFGI